MIKTKMEKINCNLCGKRDFRLLYRKLDTNPHVAEKPLPDYQFRVVQCKNCKLAFVNPRPKIEIMSNFYPGNYYQFHDSRSFAKRYDHYWSYLKGMPKGRLLDVGCSRGGFIDRVKREGWEAEGVDLFAPKKPVSKDLTIRHGYFPEMDYQDNQFDVVTSWAVFEHLHNPKEYFNKVQKILKPGGKFILLVTNINSLGSRYALEEDVPRHLFFFSKETIRKYVQKAGFSDEIKFQFDNKVFQLDGSTIISKHLFQQLGYSVRQIREKDMPWLARLACSGTNLLGQIIFRKTAFVQKWLGVYGIMVAVIKKPKN